MEIVFPFPYAGLAIALRLRVWDLMRALEYLTLISLLAKRVDEARIR